jgi:transaldolase
VSLYLDSAIVDEARRIFSFGLVKGITTNPGLVAKTGRSAVEVLAELCDVSTGIVFHQLTEHDHVLRKREAIQMAGIRPGRVGLKIPCTYENLSLAAELVGLGYIVGITAIFSTPQVYLACQSGAQYILPYVNRSTRLLGDGISIVRQMRAVIDAESSNIEIIAASIKTLDEAISTLLAGAHHLTLPIALIESMGNHPLSDKAIEEFGLAEKGNL